VHNVRQLPTTPALAVLKRLSLPRLRLYFYGSDFSTMAHAEGKVGFNKTSSNNQQWDKVNVLLQQAETN
jgi:hypothetical protein